MTVSVGLTENAVTVAPAPNAVSVTETPSAVAVAESVNTVTVVLTANAVAVTESVNAVAVTETPNTVTVASVGAKGEKGDTGETGATGPQGPAGADGKTVLNGIVAPTTEGVDGDFYIDTVTNMIYGPKATTWPAGVSLVGPTGPAGEDGDGTGDVVGPSSATDGHIAVFDQATGKLIKDGGVAPYSLPTATDSVLGGVKVGTGLSIADGVLSATGGSSPVTEYGTDATAYSEAGTDYVLKKTFTFTPSAASFGAFSFSCKVANETSAVSTTVRVTLDSAVVLEVSGTSTAYIPIGGTFACALAASEHTLKVYIKTGHSTDTAYCKNINWFYSGVPTA